MNLAPHHPVGQSAGAGIFSATDHQAYLEWLECYSSDYPGEILVYCLMNHPVQYVKILDARKG